MKTKFYKKEESQRDWVVVDASDRILGRMASQIAMRLRGKHKPIFTPNSDTGDFVIVLNAEKIKVTGDKLTQKNYYHHSGYIGGIKSKVLKDRLEKEPEKVIKDAVWGMIPKNRLGRAIMKKLKVYKGQDHPHSAQKPQPINL